VHVRQLLQALGSLGVEEAGILRSSEVAAAGNETGAAGASEVAKNLLRSSEEAAGEETGAAVASEVALNLRSSEVAAAGDGPRAAVASEVALNLWSPQVAAAGGELWFVRLTSPLSAGAAAWYGST
jgi:hypothetical protein